MAVRPNTSDQFVNFLKTVSTCTRGLEFAPEETLEALHPATAAHIEELEDLLCRLSLEAEALLWRVGISGKWGKS